MSVEKFKRILKILLIEHIYEKDDYFYIHLVDLKLCSKK
jgi:hypothetical protein